MIRFLTPMAFSSAPTVSSVLGDIGTIITDVLGWVGNCATTIVQTPLLILTTGVLMLGAAIGILGRMLSKN